MLKHELPRCIRRMKELRENGDELSDSNLILFNDREKSQRYYKKAFARGVIILSNYVKQEKEVGERIQDDMTFVYDRLNPEVFGVLFELENLGRKINEKEFLQKVVSKYLPSLPTQTSEGEWDNMFKSKLRAGLEEFRKKHSLDYKLLKYMEYLKNVPPHCIPFACSDRDLIMTYGDENREKMDAIRESTYCEVGFLAVNDRLRRRLAHDIWKIVGLEEKVDN